MDRALANGVAHEEANANGVAHKEAHGNGFTPEKVNGNGVIHKEANGNGVAHEETNGNAFTKDANGNGLAHKETSGNGLAHAAEGQQSLLLFSAYSAGSLEAQIDAFRDYAKGSNATLRDLAYTLANRREQKPHRAYAVTGDISSSLQASATQTVQKSPPRVAWIFTGQGAQWPEMGAELIDTNATFRATIRKLDKFLGSLPTPPPWTIQGKWKLPLSLQSVEQRDSRRSQTNCGKSKASAASTARRWAIPCRVRYKSHWLTSSALGESGQTLF